MAGSPTFTIVLSRPTMNRLMQQTASIRARRPRVAAAWLTWVTGLASARASAWDPGLPDGRMRAPTAGYLPGAG